MRRRADGEGLIADAQAVGRDGVRRRVHAGGAGDPAEVHQAVDGVSALSAQLDLWDAAVPVQGGIRGVVVSAVRKVGTVRGGNAQYTTEDLGERQANAHHCRSWSGNVGVMSADEA